MQAKHFCVYCINEEVGIYKPYFWLLLSVSINRSHYIALQYKSILGGEKIYRKCLLLIKSLTVAKQVA